MDSGLLVNLAATTAVQAGVGTIIAIIIRRYVAAVDRLADRVRQLEEKRIAELERHVETNRDEHDALKAQLQGRIGRDEQQNLVDRVEKVNDEQRDTALRQERTATQMQTAVTQISELFAKVAILTRDVARMQGKIDG